MPDVLNITVEGRVQWRGRRSESSQRWIAVCDAMNLVTEADSLDELHSVINETMQLTLTDLMLDGELDAFLRDLGWRAGGMPASRESGDVEFDVPWELVAEGARGSERRAH